MTLWYLEHLRNGSRVILPNGRVSIGRHSACRIQLDYLYMSREHVEITVSPNQVSVRCLSARNGLFVNNVEIGGDLVGVPLREGDLIGLGCPLLQNVSKMCPVFSLRKCAVETEAIELLSDSDDESAPLQPLKPVSDQPDKTASSIRPPCPPPPSSGQIVEDYNETMALSQEIIPKMKETAFSDSEQNSFKRNNNGGSHLSSPFHLIDNEEIIEITDSDNDDLCSSAASKACF